MSKFKPKPKPKPKQKDDKVVAKAAAEAIAENTKGDATAYTKTSVLAIDEKYWNAAASSSESYASA